MDKVYYVEKEYRYSYGWDGNNQGIIEEKEVKKMSRPYFETKVVKVKRNYRKECVGEICIRGERTPIYMSNDRILFYGKKEKLEPKGNWVNGENLDKIKFPCFCTFSERNELGMLTSGYPSYEVDEYILHRIKGQSECSAMCRDTSLKKLILDYDIHILKGKIIIWEEEE